MCTVLTFLHLEAPPREQLYGLRENLRLHQVNKYKHGCEISRSRGRYLCAIGRIPERSPSQLPPPTPWSRRRHGAAIANVVQCSLLLALIHPRSPAMHLLSIKAPNGVHSCQLACRMFSVGRQPLLFLAHACPSLSA